MMQLSLLTSWTGSCVVVLIRSSNVAYNFDNRIKCPFVLDCQRSKRIFDRMWHEVALGKSACKFVFSHYKVQHNLRETDTNKFLC